MLSRREFLASGVGAGAVPFVRPILSRGTTADPSPSFAWIRWYGEPGRNEVHDLVRTNDGNYLLAGRYTSGEQPSRAWLLKTDAGGDPLWTHRSRINQEYGSLSVVAASDGYALAGRTRRGTPDGRPRPMVLRVAPDGTERWRRTYEVRKFPRVTTLLRDPDSGFVVAGHRYVDADTGNQAEGYLLSVTERGEERWRRTYRGPRDDRLLAGAQDDDGGYVLVGNTASAGNGEEDGWLVRVDGTGREQWAATFGGTEWEEIRSVAETDAGYVIGGTTTSTGESRPLLVVTDRSGTAIWRRTFGDTDVDGRIRGVLPITTGVAVTGSSISGGSWLLKTDSWGRPQWSIDGFGLPSTIGGVTRTGDGRYVVAGAAETADKDWQAWLAAVIPPRGGTEV